MGLCDLMRGRPVIVNLIPYNPFEENVFRYETPSEERVDDFLNILAAADIRVFQRRHHGRDIAAACGQLAKQGSKKQTADIESIGGKICGGADKGAGESLQARTSSLEATRVAEAKLGREGLMHDFAARIGVVHLAFLA